MNEIQFSWGSKTWTLNSTLMLTCSKKVYYLAVLLSVIFSWAALVCWDPLLIPSTNTPQKWHLCFVHKERKQTVTRSIQVCSKLKWLLLVTQKNLTPHFCSCITSTLNRSLEQKLTKKFAIQKLEMVLKVVFDTKDHLCKQKYSLSRFLLSYISVLF